MHVERPTGELVADAKGGDGRAVTLLLERHLPELRGYVRKHAGFNTSDGVLGPLSDVVRRVADEAIRNARAEGRQTVLERDVPKG